MGLEESAERVMNGKYLGFHDLQEIVAGIRDRSVTNMQFVSLLAAMETRNRIRGIDKEESANFIRALRIPGQEQVKDLLCNAGTGGDKVKTINVGTSAAVILASAGIKVLKIGYKGITSRCGSRDLLESWGINPFQEIGVAVESTKQTGVGYYDFSKLIVVEERSGFRSPLHFLGPLCHPLELSYKILGCVNKGHLKVSESILEKICGSYLLTYNSDIDEISPVSTTFVVERRGGVRREYEFNPREIGLRNIDYYDLGHPKSTDEGADLVAAVFSGEESPRADLIALNAGAGIYLAGKADSIGEGYDQAKELLRAGKVQAKLEEWRAFSRGGHD